MRTGPFDNLGIMAALDRYVRSQGGEPNERTADVDALRQLEIAIADYVSEALYDGAYYNCPLCGAANEDA